MSREYYFLISSLPSPRLGEKPKYRSPEFLEMCAQELSPDRMQRLRAVTLLPNGAPCCEADRKWHAWETYCRNCLARARGVALGADAAEWVQPDADAFPTDRRQIEETMTAPSPAARERGLDELRWRRLGDFAVGHEFDFDALIVYRLRLLLAEKWADLTTEQGQANLLSLIDAGVAQAEDTRITSDA